MNNTIRVAEVIVTLLTALLRIRARKKIRIMPKKQNKQYQYRYRETYKDVKIDIKAASQSELISKVNKRKEQIDKQFVDNGTQLRDYVDRYLVSYKKNRVSPETFAYYQTLGNKIIDGIGNRRVSKIKPIEVQAFINGLVGYKDSYIKKIYQLTCNIFRNAYEDGLITFDYSRKIELPKGHTTSTGRSLTDKERKALLQILPGHRGELFCKIMLYCGLRPGEVIALQWKDVDFNNKTISVNKSAKRNGAVGDPKSKAAVRTIPIPEHLVPLLKANAGNPFECVCQNHGRPFTESARRAMWKSVKREMNLALGCRTFNNRLLKPFPLDDKLDMYYLRHTYCTDLERAGVPINVARRLMGHSNIAITSKIYTHDNEESIERARALINISAGNIAGKISANR